jgi:hypothetical protein
MTDLGGISNCGEIYGEKEDAPMTEPHQHPEWRCMYLLCSAPEYQCQKTKGKCQPDFNCCAPDSSAKGAGSVLELLKIIDRECAGVEKCELRSDARTLANNIRYYIRASGELRQQTKERGQR